MNKRQQWMVSVVALLSVFLMQAYAQNAKVLISSFDMGFAEQKSANTMVRAIAGQSFAGTLKQSNIQIVSSLLGDTAFRAVPVGVEQVDQVPMQFALAQNYPNPFNPTTQIMFSVGTYGHTSLRIYDVLGREVATLVDEVKPAGYYSVQWNAQGRASGVYFYRITANDFVRTKKLLLLK